MKHSFFLQHLLLTLDRFRIVILMIAIFFLISMSYHLYAQRQDISLNSNWQSIAADSNSVYNGFEQLGFNTASWKKVNVPHNWDRYEGYRRLGHGNRHGCSWYRKTFQAPKGTKGKQYFLWFEGVGSYATVWLNGKKVGTHAGGRTSFTLDVSGAIQPGEENLLAVRADHPAHIQDLPWVCGGCSKEIGFSEGSQPMGIFRPVHLIVTNEVRVEPFGVHIWNDTTVTEAAANVFINTELKNYGRWAKKFTLKNSLLDKQGNVVTTVTQEVKLKGGEQKIIPQEPPTIDDPTLWSLENPYLYTLKTEVVRKGEVIDQVNTSYGIRWISWPIDQEGEKKFLLNGDPVFINGTCEYEHMMGKSHAFSEEQVMARVSQIQAAGFNAFRDAHQPHNLRYGHAWDSLGILWWTQHTAHIWYDTPAFRENFKNLLRDWVKERRNSPSVMLWGLQNESQLPTAFAKECSDIIREMDPTTSSQRKVTTCNGGTGTDWDVPQNWTGTYGGDPDKYDEDVERQVLIGEYGAWRTLDMHTEGGFDQGGKYSEDRMTLLMEKKVRLAESAKDKTAGHFQWIFTSHENPGREQSGEAFRELDRVGPVNYKGLFTPWGEPADVFYMYRANYAPKDTEPMVYIASHTWPSRWTDTGAKDSLFVYSNCDEVELFNGVNNNSFGKKKHKGMGTHFQWDNVDIENNLLYAVGYVDGKPVAKDFIVLNHLPESPDLDELINDTEVLKPEQGLNYLYRVNCGGADYQDSQGNIWSADVHRENDETWGSTSWTDDFENMPPFYASQRRTFDPITNTVDGELFQSFRYGMDKLKYHFPVPDGTYYVDLFFVEPWYGTDKGMKCADWRNFDVAINGKTVINDLDIWQEAGHDQALKKTVQAQVKGGSLVISFPEIKSGQAIVSAIAIASENKQVKASPAPPHLVKRVDAPRVAHQTWCDLGGEQYQDEATNFSYLPPELFGAEWLQMPNKNRLNVPLSFTLNRAADVYVAIDTNDNQGEMPEWLEGYSDISAEVRSAGRGENIYQLFRKRYEEAGTTIAYPAYENPRGKVYSVFIKPASYIKPAFDLKPQVDYNEDVATLKGEGLIKEKKYKFGCVTFQNMSRDTVEWKVNVGVADYYAIHTKFSNETGKALSGTFRVIAADGTLMQEEKINFRETPETKYRLESKTTASMINAGEYTVQIIAEGAAGLSIRGIRVQ